jgi:hypothetical protein
MQRPAARNPGVDTGTSGEQLVLLQGAHVGDSQPTALSLFRPSPLPAAVLAWTPERVLLLTPALSSLLLHYPSPTPQADLFSTTRRQSPPTGAFLHRLCAFPARGSPWLSPPTLQLPSPRRPSPHAPLHDSPNHDHSLKSNSAPSPNSLVI